MMERTEGPREEATPADTPAPAVSWMSRRDFLKISGAGLAGAVLLGVAGCGGGGGEGGAVGITFATTPEPTGTFKTLIDEVN